MTFLLWPRLLFQKVVYSIRFNPVTSDCSQASSFQKVVYSIRFNPRKTTTRSTLLFQKVVYSIRFNPHSRVKFQPVQFQKVVYSIRFNRCLDAWIEIVLQGCLFNVVNFPDVCWGGHHNGLILRRQFYSFHAGGGDRFRRLSIPQGTKVLFMIEKHFFSVEHNNLKKR